MSIPDGYATFANFGGGRGDLSSRPQIKRVVISECIKRRLPSKHYVYKMVVEWTTGTTSNVYRRYSMFFDFQVKLQELYYSVCQRNPQFAERVPHLPEMPGKILFGRSHIHQVAEKRRGKIGEFCQQVVSLPPEISQTNLVMGFFNTWPEDTMLPPHSDRESVSSVSSHTSSFTSSILSSTLPTILTSDSTPIQTSSTTSATEAVISHPDEMENLEQYCVVADYHRKDSHQVNLSAGQVVHVIEKHDTGWWMVMADDEQGYAPAAYLEPVEGGGRHMEEVMDSTTGNCEEYEAMESFSAQNEDEVDFRVGDKVEVISKSLDGWWKIRCNTKVGLAPSALIRKRMAVPQLPRDDDVIYESHKTIYEGLNIHKPPPRRNTIKRNKNYGVGFEQVMYAVPRANPPLVKMAADLTLSATEENDYVDPPLELTSEDEEDTGYYRIPRSIHSQESSTRVNGSMFGPPRKTSEDSALLQSTGSVTSTTIPQHDSASSDPPIFPTPVNFAMSPQHDGEDIGGSSIYDVVPEESPYEVLPEESPYEMEPTPSSSVSNLYQNSGDARAEAEAFKNSAGHSLLTTIGIISGNTRGDIPSPVSPSTASPPPRTPSSIDREEQDSDYVDIDQHDEYVDPEELIAGECSSAGEPATPLSPTPHASIFKPLPKPPLPTSNPPKKRPKMAKTQSLSIELSEIMEDEYIPMEPIYTEPPPESAERQDSTALSTADTTTVPQQKQQKQQQQPPPPSSSSSSSAAPQGKQKKQKHKAARDKVQISSPVLVDVNSGGITRAKSLEDLLASNSSRESSPQRLGSPPGERKLGPGGRMGSPGRVPILPPVPTGKGKGSEPSESKSIIAALKPKPGKVKVGKAKKRSSSNVELCLSHTKNSEVPHHLLQSSSPPRGPSPVHRSITHSTSVPLHPVPNRLGRLPKESVHLKTYVAMSDYQSQDDGCLSFQAGDKCVLLRKTNDGWWLVNIGGREGWTPEGFWKEEAWNQASTIARPPGPAPSIAPHRPQERKPRSHTVATDSTSVVVGSSILELSSSMEGSLEASSGQSSWSGSVEVERQQPSGDREGGVSGVAGVEGKKPIPPPPPPQDAKPGRRGPPPPKPKPFASSSPWKKGDKRPLVPQKPSIAPPVAPKPQSTPSPPLPRRQNDDLTILTPSPPPPPAAAPPTAPPAGQRRNDTAENSSEYVMLENAHTLDTLESSPWFVGKMERVSAEHFLMEHGRQREFLVRERTAKDGYYALSIRYHYSCKHFNIDPTAQGQYSIGTLVFPAIMDIVHHYQHNSLFIHEGQHVTLSSPARRRTRGTADTRTHS